MRYVTIVVNWLLAILLGIAGFRYYDVWLPLIDGNRELAIGAAGALISSMVFSIRRRIISDACKDEFFVEKDLMTMPKNKARYSDRVAYLLAEMSELAYFEVERENDNFVQFVEKAIDVDPENSKLLNNLVDHYKKKTRTESTTGTTILNEKDLADLLDKNGFEYKSPYLNSGSAQGFICLRKDTSDPFVIVAFRGTEMKVEDWLTNVKAEPASPSKVKQGKVHSGFYEDFTGLKDVINNTIQKICKNLNRSSIPVYFTGHSLGGAIATIATKELMPDGNGACYTFGAPRVGDYEYFQFVKTPVYRIVNSSDIVPRVPPGAWMNIILKIITLIRYVSVKFERVTKVITAVEGWVNRLKDYRHFGDLRYLTDVQAGKSDQVMLLRSPNYFDVLQWFWRHVLVSYGMPVKSHSLTIYRNKLAQVGLKRMRKESIGKSFGYFA